MKNRRNFSNLKISPAGSYACLSALTNSSADRRTTAPLGTAWTNAALSIVSGNANTYIEMALIDRTSCIASKTSTQGLSGKARKIGRYKESTHIHGRTYAKHTNTHTNKHTNEHAHKHIHTDRNKSVSLFFSLESLKQM